jgi:SAM-dependent methyltransferase
MLLDKKDVFESLRCPKSGSKLKKIGDRLIPESSTQSIAYEFVGDCPILIDFDKGILKKEGIATLSNYIDKYAYTGILGFFRSLVSPQQQETIENVDRLMQLLLTDKDTARVLIVGGGTVGQSIECFYTDKRIELISFDIYASPNVQFVADGHNIPLIGESFDAVIIQAVLEHVLEPSTVVSEIYRVLKKDGIVYAETPFLQHVHEGAYDFTRYTESGHRYLFKDFELIQSGSCGGAGTQLLWSIDNFVRGVFRSRRVGKVVKLGFFWLQYFDKMIPESYNIDAASGVFFLGRKRSTSINGREVIAHYKGAQM